MTKEAQAETEFIDKKFSINLQESELDIQHPSDVIGGWGPSQKRIVFYLILIYTVAPFSNSHIIFTAPSKVDFYCVDFDPLTNTSVYLKNSCTIGNYTEAPKCQKFEHDRSFHKRTLVNTFDLVCDKAWYPSFSQSVHQLGYGVSGIVLGIISDRRGRFFCAKIAIAIEILAGLTQAFAPNIYVYFVARFFVGIGAYGRFLNGLILLSEWVGPKMRGKFAAAVYGLGNQVGSNIMLAAFYFLADYYVIELWARIAEIFLFIGYIFVVKESPRWLLTHGKWKEAEQLLKSVAMEKGVYKEREIDERIAKLKEFTMKEQEKLEKEQQGKQSVFDIWKDPNLLKTSMILYFSYFSMAFIGYASGLNVGQLGGSVYGIQLFHKIMAYPTILLVYFIIPRFDRRSLARTCLFVMVVCLLGAFGSTFDPSLFIPLIVFNRAYKTSGGIAIKTLSLVATEIFPTTMRQTSIGICSVFARMGSVVAPFIKELTIATYLWVPFAIYTVLAMMTAFLCLFLPNTFDIHLPDNIKQSKKVEEETVQSRSRSTSHAV